MLRAAPKEPTLVVMSGPPPTVPINRDPFEILEEAGSGGMGTVYRARDRATGRLLALKTLKGAEVNRFTLEANVLKKLQHACIVEYVLHGVTEDGRQFLAMEWLEGESLEERVRRGPLSVAETLRITRAIADALAFAHDAGVVHRDLKPSNVFITSEGAVKLLDFGIAKSNEVEGLTSTGQALGTPGYMSPEQARGGAVDGRSDLFALGCVIFRSLGGRRPFEGSDLMTFVTKLALEAPSPLCEVAPRAPRSLEALVARLLEKEPENRPPNAAAVRDALDAVAGELPDSSLASTERAPSAADEPASSYPPTQTADAGVATDIAARTLRISGAPEVPGRAGDERAPTTMISTPPPSTIDATMRSPSPAGDRPPRSTKQGPAPAPTPARAPSVSTPAPAPRGGAGLVLVIVASLGLVATGLVVAHRMTKDGAGASGLASELPSASPSSAPSGALAGDGPLLRDADRVALDRACREWSALIARGQRGDGAFASDSHADPSGWDSGQQLYSLTEAHRACGGVGPAPLASGATALVKLRVDDGWIGPRRPTGANYNDHRAETPAIAWGLLALSGVVRETTDTSMVNNVARARADLLKARMPDGGFRFIARSAGSSTLYSTMLASWALLESAPESGALAPELEGALAWLRREVTSGSEAVHQQGITEQVGWLLARAERRQHDPGGREALHAAAAEIIAHCRLDKTACRRPTYDTGKAALDVDAGKLVTLWHPWATVGSYELARQPVLPLDGEELASLGHVARWGNGELGGAVTSLATAPEYKLSEYLIVVAKTLEPR